MGKFVKVVEELDTSEEEIERLKERVSQLQSRISVLNTNLRAKDDQIEILLKQEKQFTDNDCMVLAEFCKSELSKWRNRGNSRLIDIDSFVKKWNDQIKRGTELIKQLNKATLEDLLKWVVEISYF